MNDDWTIYYGWDYAAHVLTDFKARTGLDAPRKMERPAKFGVIADNDPWVEWFKYCLLHIGGAMNKAETEGALAGWPEVRVGPIPGGMQIPLVMLWQPTEYPPYNFGPNGFNLIASYYYNTYWQPVLTDTFWMEIGRMGNRQLPRVVHGRLLHDRRLHAEQLLPLPGRRRAGAWPITPTAERTPKVGRDLPPGASRAPRGAGAGAAGSRPAGRSAC